MTNLGIPGFEEVGGYPSSSDGILGETPDTSISVNPGLAFLDYMYLFKFADYCIISPTMHNILGLSLIHI